MNVDWVSVQVSSLFKKFFAILAILLLAACGNRPAATPFHPTITPTLGEQTLPPTWTPTASFTPPPPGTATTTPSPVPTASIADLCTNFQILYSPVKNVILKVGDAALFEWKGVPPDAPMKLTVTQANSIAGLAADVPIEGDGVLPIPISQLPGSGDYVWRAWLQHPTFGAICVQQGTFSVRQILVF